MEVYGDSETQLRDFGAWMGCGWRPEKSRLFKSWMKDDAQVRDACRESLE